MSEDPASDLVPLEFLAYLEQLERRERKNKVLLRAYEAIKRSNELLGRTHKQTITMTAEQFQCICDGVNRLKAQLAKITPHQRRRYQQAEQQLGELTPEGIQRLVETTVKLNLRRQTGGRVSGQRKKEQAAEWHCIARQKWQEMSFKPESARVRLIARAVNRSKKTVNKFLVEDGLKSKKIARKLKRE